MVDVNSIASGAMSVGEAAEKENEWRVLIYGNPGTGKTHFAYSMPKPVCLIDTERKADAVARKFEDEEVYLWQVKNYDEAKEALAEALDVLDAFRREESQIGTVAVDSMSRMWDWSQQKHMEIAYPGRDPEEVDFQSALQGDNDWQMIKRFHNQRFRDVMVDSPYHCCWTAKAQEDYGAILEGQDEPPAKDQGEKSNKFEATELIHVYEGENAVPAANLKKTDKTRMRFGGLEWPTFEKVRKTILETQKAEASDEEVPLSELLRRFPDSDVEMYDGDPDLAMRNGDNE